jgi:hypothetical protein
LHLRYLKSLLRRPRGLVSLEHSGYNYPGSDHAKSIAITASTFRVFRYSDRGPTANRLAKIAVSGRF